MGKSFGERELAVVEMARRVATKHWGMAAPFSAHGESTTRHVNFTRVRSAGQRFRFRIAFYDGLILSVQASLVSKGLYRVISPGISEENREQEGYCFELDSSLAMRSTNPGGYGAVQRYRFLLRDDGFIHDLSSN